MNKIDKNELNRLNDELIGKITQAEGDAKTELAWELTHLNILLVPHVVHRYFSREENQEDMMSDGRLALFNACLKVKPNTMHQVFVGYAVKCIFGQVSNGIKDRVGQVHYPIRKALSFRHNEQSIDEVFVGYHGEEFESSLEKSIVCDNSRESSGDKPLHNSDGEFCKHFIKLSKRHTNTSRKRNGARGEGFYGATNIKILELLGGYDVSEIVELMGLHKQQIVKTKQAIFGFMVQYLRDATQLKKDEFFAIIFEGKYSVENPPPFEGWRKRMWETVMASKKHSYITASTLNYPAQAERDIVIKAKRKKEKAKKKKEKEIEKETKKRLKAMKGSQLMQTKLSVTSEA